MTTGEFLEIDGSFGEGGGSILRVGAGFSVLFERPIRIKNIRANRPTPGLRQQHLVGLKTLSELTQSILSDCKVGSTEITLHPKKNIKSNIQVKIGTAGSIGLLLQPIQIASLGLSAPYKIEIKILGGGSYGKWAPGLNYLREVPYQIFKKVGLNIGIEVQKHGFYPKGGAIVKCTIKSSKNKIAPILLTELGNVKLVQGEIIITNQLKGKNIGARIKKTVQEHLKKNLKVDIEINYKHVNSLSPGVGLLLWAHSDTGAIISTGTLIGEKKISAENLGKIAANSMINYIKNKIPVDNYLSDQLIPIMGYANEPSKIKVQKITNHTKTNLKLTKLFVNRNYKIIKEKNHYIIEF